MSEELNMLDDLNIDFDALKLPEKTDTSQPTHMLSGDVVSPFFGPYQLLSEIGSGGVASVHRARHIHPQYTDKPLAVKVLHDSLSRDPMVISLFRREAYVLSLLKHPSIVQTFEAGSQDNRLFIAMEYIDGRDLDAFLYRCHYIKLSVPIAVLCYIIGEVLRALIYAHQLKDNDNAPLNLVHRDINPANVFLSFNGHVKLGDFGVASITAGRVEKSRELAGKIGYFAPEQIEGGIIDQRVDIFALGAMMFEMLCGVHLFDAKDPDQALKLNRKAKVPKPSKYNPSIPAGLEKVILKALERRPEDRFQSCQAMLDALEPYFGKPHNMRLATASLMRTLFLREHMKETQLHQSLSGQRVHGIQGQMIDLLTHDERACGAFSELLKSNGYRIRIHNSIAQCSEAIQKEAPYAILVDVDQDDFSPADFNAALQKTGRIIPLIASCSNLDNRAIDRACEIRAGDLLCKPLYADRVLTAIIGATKREAPKPALRQTAHEQISNRVLLFGKDPAFNQHLQSLLRAQKMTVQIVTDAPMLETQIKKKSYGSMIFDVGSMDAASASHAAAMRLLPGLQLLPMLYLFKDSQHDTVAAVMHKHTLTALRSEPLERKLNELVQYIAHHRLYMRFPVRVEGHIRYGGRLSNASSINLSRGGVLLQCEQIPPLGTYLSAILELDPQTSVQVSGRVVRVALSNQETGETAQVGIEFDGFSGTGEAALIAFLDRLDDDTKEH